RRRRRRPPPLGQHPAGAAPGHHLPPRLLAGAPVTPLGRAEYADRWRRLQRGMAEAALDALLVTSQTNFEYLAGYRTPAWIIRARPQVVVVPATSDPIGVVASTHAAELGGEGILH